MDNRVRLQNLRSFTVQIRRLDNDQIVGTGIAVSMDGQIVTCAHVVEAAGIVDPRHANGAEVGVYFPQASDSEVKARKATVARCFPQHDDDVVLLQLVGGSSPLAPEQIAILGQAEGSDGNKFRSYGYRRLQDYIAGFAHGDIMGLVPPPENRKFQAEPLQLESNQINHGMSGAAVLDEERNLVVGIISETWYPDQSGKDSDIAWAVDAHVLSFDPLKLTLRENNLPLRDAPRSRIDIGSVTGGIVVIGGTATFERDVTINTPSGQPFMPPPPSLKDAPLPLPEWVGRDDLLRAISADWADPAHRVTGLIGFGGEGKSSLARQWLDSLLTDPNQLQPEGVFWWAFYDRPNVDEFFEAALAYVGGGLLDPRNITSANLKAHVIAGMLYARRYLFVLDGIEVMQHQDGDRYGLLTSGDLREFLGLFAAPGHSSFCLITSRAPLLDLMEFTTYVHHEVDRLSDAEGRALLRKVGVKGGSDAVLDGVVHDWGGHALTLSLLAAYLKDQHGGDVAHIGTIPPPIAAEPRYERVHRVLRRYDEHVSEAEQRFLMVFSAFRTPVAESAFARVFRAKTAADALNAPLTALDDAAFARLLQRLVSYRLLRYDADQGQYTTHPLIRAHYFARLSASDAAQVRTTHAHIKDHYLALAGDMPHFPTLDDLKPLIEVVYHACHAGAYDEAHRIGRERIDQGHSYVMTHQLGAYETRLALILEFFPGGNPAGEPQVSDPGGRAFILNEVGVCLMALGRLNETAPFYERAKAIRLSGEDWRNASIDCRNLAELHTHRGALTASAEAASLALHYAQWAANKQDERDSRTDQAWSAHLRGLLAEANTAFGQAESLEREINSAMRYLYGLRGTQHAAYLRRSGQADYARRVTEANRAICQEYHLISDLSRCHRILGNLEADVGEHETARAHYNEALSIARGISVRDTLIEALLARGRWSARRGEVAAARADLDEALTYALAGSYRIYEADLRVALAWAYQAAGDPASARAEAIRAQSMSAEMGYHWGQLDAAEVLAAL